MTSSEHTVLLCGEAARTAVWRQQIHGAGNHRVTATCSSLRDARALVRDFDVDVIVCDLRFSGATAIQLVRELRAGSGHAGTMILVVTPSASDPELLQCLSSGADSYYVDQGPGPSLDSRINEMIKGESKMSPEIARKVLDHFRRESTPRGSARAVDEMLNPLSLSNVERVVLVRLSQGQSVPEIASAERLSMHQVAKCVRALYRKMSWDLRADGLALELL
jgi:DNA-binding NarL/FixJ family response regulator